MPSSWWISSLVIANDFLLSLFLLDLLLLCFLFLGGLLEDAAGAAELEPGTVKLEDGAAITGEGRSGDRTVYWLVREEICILNCAKLCLFSDCYKRDIVRGRAVEETRRADTKTAEGRSWAD